MLDQADTGDLSGPSNEAQRTLFGGSGYDPLESEHNSQPPPPPLSCNFDQTIDCVVSKALAEASAQPSKSSKKSCLHNNSDAKRLSMTTTLCYALYTKFANIQKILKVNQIKRLFAIFLINTQQIKTFGLQNNSLLHTKKMTNLALF
jgi:hypothetical protein